MIDITAPESVEIVLGNDLKTVWVNVDGICQFRACRIGVITIDDRSDDLPRNYCSADEAATMLNLSKKVFLNLSQRGDIKGQTNYDGKRVWEREVIEKLAEELKEVF